MTKKLRYIKYIIAAIALISSVTFGLHATLGDTPADESASASLHTLVRETKLGNFTARAQRLAEHAAQYLGTRYRYGSTGPKTFDCSGFIGHVFRQEGIKLPRTSRMQYTEGQKISREDIRPGDLLFFSCPGSGKGRVGHVAMVVNVDKDSNSLTFIHASRSKGVSYQKFPDGGYYSRHYIGAKRVLPDSPAA